MCSQSACGVTNQSPSHCSSTQPRHVDGKPHPGFHATFGGDARWHGQVSQSCPEDRPAHGGQHPVCSGRLRWEHGHVHASACEFSVIYSRNPRASDQSQTLHVIQTSHVIQTILSVGLLAVLVSVPHLTLCLLLSAALAGLPEPLCRGPPAHEPPGSHGLQLQPAAGSKSRLAHPLQRGRSPVPSGNGPAQP